MRLEEGDVSKLQHDGCLLVYSLELGPGYTGETMMTYDLRLQNQCFDCQFIWVCSFVDALEQQQLGLQEISRTMWACCNCCQLLQVLYA